MNRDNIQALQPTPDCKASDGNGIS